MVKNAVAVAPTEPNVEITANPTGPQLHARPRLFVFTGAITCAFFFLSTHMHENHLLMAIPFFLAAAGRARSFARLALLATVASFLNMLLHDLDLPFLFPGFLGQPTPASSWFSVHPLTWPQILGSLLNAALVGTLTVLSFRAALNRR